MFPHASPFENTCSRMFDRLCSDRECVDLDLKNNQKKLLLGSYHCRHAYVPSHLHISLPFCEIHAKVTSHQLCLICNNNLSQ